MTKGEKREEKKYTNNINSIQVKVKKQKEEEEELKKIYRYRSKVIKNDGVDLVFRVAYKMRFNLKIRGSTN